MKRFLLEIEKYDKETNTHAYVSMYFDTREEVDEYCLYRYESDSAAIGCRCTDLVINKLVLDRNMRDDLVFLT